MPNSLGSRRLTRWALFGLMVHAAVFALVYYAAFELKFDFKVSPREWTIMWLTMSAVLIVKTAIFYAAGHCHRSWRHIAFSDLAAILRSATVASVVMAALDYLMATEYHIPRAVLVLDWGLTILALGGLRAVSRLSREEMRSVFFWKKTRKALIVGANPSGETLSRHLLVDQRLKCVAVGFLDDDASKHGSTVGGLTVFGYPHDTVRHASRLEVEDIFVIAGVLTGSEVRQLMSECAAAELNLKVIPALDDLLSSDYSIQPRNVDINDLLRREPVKLSTDDIAALIAGRTVMVTGAGGSIGSEICRQVLKFRPTKLLLVERAENSLFLVEQEFRSLRGEIQVIPCIADISDRNRMDQVFGEYRPDIVFHAAAHKHVPMMEYNPGEAIKNNIQGTQLLVELADRHAVGEFVMISTDKAVNPTSVMGVSKHFAERFVNAFSEASTTKFVVVRFGNVLASNGSVVPIFQEQIRRGGPITVTHPDIERFFMTIPEASQLVLQAAAMGKGGEIFVLDMGESVRIVDLARDLIRLSGLGSDDIEIVFTGLRPGEKLYEELYFEDEEMQATPHPKLFVAYHRPFSLAEVRASLSQLALITHESADVIRARLQELIPEYRPPKDPAHVPAPVDVPETVDGVRLPIRHTPAVSTGA